MAAHPSGFYAWRQQPKTERQRDDERMSGVRKQVWLESDGRFGYRKLTLELRDLGEPCSKRSVAKLLRGAVPCPGVLYAPC